MKTFLLSLALLLPLAACNCSKPQIEEEKEITKVEISDTPLSKAEADEAFAAIRKEWKAAMDKNVKADWDAKSITIGGQTMKFWHKTYGNVPEGGHSLYISLHGGGSAPASVNDGQWENQKVLYTPAEGVYVAPRAPYDDWDMWFKPLLDEFYAKLILMYQAEMNINPNKVYLMGYSAGGDGVWRMAPRMADSWAAASMMAGHPGDISMLNLRNTPFMIWCGALDSAYNRNEECRKKTVELDSLHNADPAGYIHENHIVEGKEHWMDRVDAAAVPWMAQFTRNPYPSKIVWQQEEVLRKTFYWIEAPSTELARRKTVRLETSGNTIEISECDYSSLILWLNDSIADLDSEITVLFKGKEVFKGKTVRTSANIKANLYSRNDPNYAFPAKIDINF